MEEFEKFYNKALRFLSFRPRSEKEIRDNLLKKKAPQETIEKVATKLKEYNFINDLDFAKWWIEQRTTFRPKALKIIKFELKLKGIANEIIEKMIYDLKFVNKDLENARKLAEKKFKKIKNLDKGEIYQKLGGFLARKGFDWETAKKAIDYVYGTKRS